MSAADQPTSALYAQPKTLYPAKINARHVIAAGRKAKIPVQDIRQLLALGQFGETVPDPNVRHISKGIKLDLWSKLKRAIRQCDKKLAAKGLPEDVWIAINSAKNEYLTQLSKLTGELDTISKSGPSHTNGTYAPHGFGPREQIGNVTAVQVNIGQATEQSPVTDVNRETL